MARKTGAGFNIPKNPRRSNILYGHHIDPKKPDEPVIINDKMIKDQVYTSRSCHIVKSDFMSAMQEYSTDPRIQWETPDSKDAFLRDCERFWDLAAA